MAETRARGFLPLAVVTALASGARASESRFAFTRESDVLPAEHAELRNFSTFRLGRERYFSRVDERLAFVWGASSRFQGAFEWSVAATAKDEPNPDTKILERRSTFRFVAASTEWTYGLSDPIADVLGAALVVNVGYGPERADVGGGLILDKRLGDLLFAANLSGLQTWSFAARETESEQDVRLNLAGGYFLTPAVFAGIEALSTTLIRDEDLQSSAVYVGPAIAWSAERFWLVLSALPQVFAPKSAEGTLDLDTGEHVRARLLVAFRL